MKNLLLLCNALLVSVVLPAQQVNKAKFSTTKGSIEYAYFCESSQPKGLLIAFEDNDASKWNMEAWCQELYPIAEKNEWLLVVPALPVDNVDRAALVANFIGSFDDSVDVSNARFIVLGSAWERLEDVIPNNIPGLVISPSFDSLRLGRLEADNLAIAIHASVRQDQAKLLVDSLAGLGIWTRYVETSEEDAYYIEDHYQVYDNLLLWVDSMQKVLSDTVALEKLTTQSGLENQIPEVLKQGQKIRLSLWVNQPGNYHIQVLDLSSKAVFERDSFLGKGKHEITVPTKDFEWGVYHLEIIDQNIRERHKFMIRG